MRYEWRHRKWLLLLSYASVQIYAAFNVAAFCYHYGRKLHSGDFNVLTMMLTLFECGLSGRAFLQTRVIYIYGSSVAPPVFNSTPYNDEAQKIGGGLAIDAVGGLILSTALSVVGCDHVHAS